MSSSKPSKSRKSLSHKVSALWSKQLLTVGLAAMMAGGLALAVSTYAGSPQPTNHDKRIAEKYVGTSNRYSVCAAIRRAEGPRGHDHTKGIAKVLKDKMSSQGFKFYDTGCA